MAQETPRERAVVQEKGGAAAQQVIGDMDLGQVTVRAEDATISRGVLLGREQAMKHGDVDRPWLDGGAINGVNEQGGGPRGVRGPKVLRALELEVMTGDGLGRLLRPNDQAPTVSG